MPEEMQKLTDSLESVKRGLTTITVLLDSRPELAGSLTVEDYFLVVDLVRTYVFHDVHD